MHIGHNKCILKANRVNENCVRCRIHLYFAFSHIRGDSTNHSAASRRELVRLLLPFLVEIWDVPCGLLFVGQMGILTARTSITRLATMQAETKAGDRTELLFIHVPVSWDTSWLTPRIPLLSSHPPSNPHLSAYRCCCKHIFHPQNMAMERAFSNKSPYLLLFSVVFLILPITNAQIGTITQDITTLAAFPLQKPCARSCFLTDDFCPNDLLGSKIGCATHTACSSNGWQATNDCYCRPDLQNPAQAYLTSCIQKSCKVGDFAIDASTAGSIYAQYCVEKGYSPQAQPATVQATTTGLGASSRVTAGGAGAGPTASSTSQNSSSGSGKLSITTIIGIVVGGLAGLVFLLTVLKMLWKWFGCQGRSKVTYPQQLPPPNPHPVYPMNHYSQPYFPRPNTDGLGDAETSTYAFVCCTGESAGMVDSLCAILSPECTIRTFPNRFHSYSCTRGVLVKYPKYFSACAS
ncbi:uncharacterized protein BDR25DRAFT_356483 [Lindgomyces ingoldianus]|uniref:Uncharacterized protein n=1 Tax=Lindgomyces ingoldianus TaxID=673940 RepID=A0ACB6QQF8_9PLEO|nr:uncharacterized protein BDR25DRAFT_356483 [Lindgomyces ingoldianus]KAF2469233.1 hypothetical protein BDR25DRAFT_356483 [Lindgomyces ingoldianus]